MSAAISISAAGSPPVSDSLLSLAPNNLRNYRQIRYSGDDQYIELGQLVERDQTLLHDLYRKLNELLYTIVDKETDDAQKWRGVVLWTQRHDPDVLVGEVRAFGQASRRRSPSEELSKAIHDLRGGGLSALLGRLQLLDHLPQEEAQLKALFVLTRDHLKIMRNAVVGLDEPRRNADREPKAHAMRMMVEKWHESVVGPKWQERPVRMQVDCRYDGALTECCLESAAIDRIFYNLAANAARHTSGERLDLVIFPLPEPSDCLRFILSNEVTDADAEQLQAMAHAGDADGATPIDPRSLVQLFAPETSSTGSGFGLTVVADFVASAFGLRDRAQALYEGYAGAILDGRTFRVWFHWPMAHDNLPPKLDDYHHPEQSLSEP